MTQERAMNLQRGTRLRKRAVKYPCNGDVSGELVPRNGRGARSRRPSVQSVSKWCWSDTDNALAGNMGTCSVKPRSTQVMYVHCESVKMANVSTFEPDACVPFTTQELFIKLCRPSGDSDAECSCCFYFHVVSDFDLYIHAYLAMLKLLRVVSLCSYS